MALSLEDGNKLKSYYKPTVTVWFAMAVALLVYLSVGLFLIEREPSAAGREFKLVFYVLSFIIILLSRFFKSLILSNERVSNAASNGVRTLGGLLLTYYVVTFALCESVGVYGLVLYTVLGTKADLYTLSALSLVCLIFNYPKFEFWQETYERAQAAYG